VIQIGTGLLVTLQPAVGSGKERASAL
jgi:hypothetical protein